MSTAQMGVGGVLRAKLGKVPGSLVTGGVVGLRLLVTHWPGPQPVLATYLASRFPKWQVPDGFIFPQGLPQGATGKVDRQRLRVLSAPASTT